MVTEPKMEALEVPADTLHGLQYRFPGAVPPSLWTPLTPCEVSDASIKNFGIAFLPLQIGVLATFPPHRGDRNPGSWLHFGRGRGYFRIVA